MPPRKRAPADDSSSDEDINMDKMIETKDEISKIRKDREAQRAQLQKDLGKTLAELRQRIKQTVDAHTQQRDDITKEQLDRLRQAVAARDNIEQMIRKKLVEIQLEFKRVVAVLDSGYEYRLDKANKSVVSKALGTPESEQKTAQEQARQVKKAKNGASSS